MKRIGLKLLAGAMIFGVVHTSNLLAAPADVLIVAGPRTPESLDPAYPPTEAVHEARRNIYDRLLVYKMQKDEKSGALVENFDELEGALAESHEVGPDYKTITFHLRKGVKSPAGNEMTADDVMWSFEAGWASRATFHWYMSEFLKIKDLNAFEKLDDYTVRVTLPDPSLLIDKIWANSDIVIIDSKAAKEHATADDPYAARYLATHSASFGPYYVEKFAPGKEVIYSANPNYYRGEAELKKVIFREIPTSSNRLAALSGGAVDVAEWLTPREIALAKRSPKLHVWQVFGNYSHWIEINTTIAPLDDQKVRQALNYLIPREAIMKSVYADTARETKSIIAEVYPDYTERNFHYSYDLDKAKQLLQEAGVTDGTKIELAYRNDEPVEEEIAVILSSVFKKAGIDLVLSKLPAASLVNRYKEGSIAMFFRRDMAIVPDSAYSANLFVNSNSWVNYTRYKNEEIDKLINKSLISTDRESRSKDMKKVQDLAIDGAPWIFLFNPGYQLVTNRSVKSYSWYTPNGNSWYDFSKGK